MESNHQNSGSFIYRKFPVTAGVTILGPAELGFPLDASVHIQIVDEFRGVILQNSPAVSPISAKKKN
jgi:hypothetical protein